MCEMQVRSLHGHARTASHARHRLLKISNTIVESVYKQPENMLDYVQSSPDFHHNAMAMYEIVYLVCFICDLGQSGIIEVMTMYEIMYLVCPICDLGQSGMIEVMAM